LALPEQSCQSWHEEMLSYIQVQQTRKSIGQRQWEHHVADIFLRDVRRALLDWVGVGELVLRQKLGSPRTCWALDSELKCKTWQKTAKKCLKNSRDVCSLFSHQNLFVGKVSGPQQDIDRGEQRAGRLQDIYQQRDLPRKFTHGHVRFGKCGFS